MHVVAEIGFWAHPWTMKLARVSNCPLAGAYVLRLRELVLAHGTHDGRLLEHSLADIAAGCGWTGNPRRFAGLMSRWLHQSRGTWRYVAWTKTPMGRYASFKEWDRQRKIDERRASKEASLDRIKNGDGNGEGGGGGGAEDDDHEKRTSSGRPMDIHQRPPGRSMQVSKEGAPDRSGKTPRSPPKGGENDAGRGEKRWEWMCVNYPKLRDPDKCRRYLEDLSEAEWRHLCYAVPKLRDGIYIRKGYRFTPYSDKFLRQKGFIEVPMPSASELKAEKQAAKTKPAKPTAAQEVEAKRANAERYLFEQLGDPAMDVRAKEQIKMAWVSHWKTKPWEEENDLG